MLPPAVDHDEGGLRVFESGAVMLYILECKAPAAGGEAAEVARQLLPPPSEPAKRAEVLSWLFRNVVKARGHRGQHSLPIACKRWAF
jgi:glutathione S-transferase